jgi:hypothetical protein
MKQRAGKPVFAFRVLFLRLASRRLLLLDCSRSSAYLS